MSRLKDTIAKYYNARRIYESEKARIAELEATSRRLEQEVVDALIDEGHKSISMADGTRPTLAKKVSISVTQDNDEAIRKWLLETEGDDTPYIVTHADKWRVHALVKSKIEKESLAPEDFPEFLKVNSRPGLRIGGWNKVYGNGVTDNEEE